MFGGGLRSLVAAAKSAANQLPNNSPQTGQTTDEHESPNVADGGLFPLMPQKAAMQRRQQPPSPRDTSPSNVSLDLLL